LETRIGAGLVEVEGVSARFLLRSLFEIGETEGGAEGEGRGTAGEVMDGIDAGDGCTEEVEGREEEFTDCSAARAEIDLFLRFLRVGVAMAAGATSEVACAPEAGVVEVRTIVAL